MEKNKYDILGALGREVGGHSALVLLNLIDTFPDKMVLIDDKAWMRADPDASAKIRMNSKLYYEAINILIGHKYLDEIIEGKKHFYKINFEKLYELGPNWEDGKYTDSDGFSAEVIDDEKVYLSPPSIH